MSEQTKAALDAALSTHLADECDGAIVTGYAIHASYLNAEMESDSTGYFAEYADNQARHTTIGLVQMHLSYLLSTVKDYDEPDE